MTNAIKTKALSTQTPAAPVATSFLSQLNEFAKPVVKAEASKADPLVAMRSKFKINADEVLKALKDGAKSRWFTKLPSGQYMLCFRNANSVMKINEQTHFACIDLDAAVKTVELVKSAAAGGELDEAFKASARAPKKKADNA